MSGTEQTKERSRAHRRPVPPAARPLQGKRAGVVTRFVADALDLGVIIVAEAAILFAVGGLRFLVHQTDRLGPARPPSEMSFALGWALLLLYLTIGWSASGRTLGKQAAGLRVVNHRGERLRPVGAFVRALICVLFPIGLFWSAVSRRSASVADLILRTSVIYDWAPSLPPAESGSTRGTEAG